jgi:hypothetical protein
MDARLTTEQRELAVAMTVVGHAALAVGGIRDPELLSAYLYSRAQSVMGGTSQIQKNVIASRILGLGA